MKTVKLVLGFILLALALCSPKPDKPKEFLPGNLPVGVQPLI